LRLKKINLNYGLRCIVLYWKPIAELRIERHLPYEIIQKSPAWL